MVDSNRRGLVVFQDKKIRCVWHDDQWWFSVVDIVGVLTENSRARKYWGDLKSKLLEEGFEVSDFIGQLKLLSEDGKMRSTDCANTESMFRIIQAIPSKKVESLKRWLAKVGYERIQEIENPELAQKRMKEIYKAKGYSDQWIEKRVRGIAIRQELTDEWKQRDVQEGKEYAILTDEISKATFGKTVKEYQQFKGLKRQNLRDHMDDLELIFTMLGEKVTTKITQKKDSKDFKECKDAAHKGGVVAGKAREEAEKQIGEPVVKKENYLEQPEKVKRLEKK